VAYIAVSGLRGEIQTIEMQIRSANYTTFFKVKVKLSLFNYISCHDVGGVEV